MKSKILSKNKLSKIKAFYQGNIDSDINLGNMTSLKVGGCAKWFFTPKDDMDLRNLISYLRRNQIDYHILGGGANTFIKTRVIKRVVISLSSIYFKSITRYKNFLTARSGVPIQTVVRFAEKFSLSGLELMKGIPGSIGGAVYMNAGGGYRSKQSDLNQVFWIGDSVAAIRGIDGRHTIKVLNKNQIKFSYRNSHLNKFIITEVTFDLKRASQEAVKRKGDLALKKKKQSQDLSIPSSGCFFKNPKGYRESAGEIISSCGLNGLRVGGAMVSLKHGNFILNKGRATQRDILKLVTVIKKTVKRKRNIILETEVIQL